ncbi:MAG TPA: DoxX family protein [Pirellulaceae bacterium]|nr:DoxX family protein [Pirellulaceae bacterium]HMO92447.1 DoxX family protein [Pirellulaceae bacterium]HMP67883.1 DoxX family protein [Pirellulaceae bacterium]
MIYLTQKQLLVALAALVVLRMVVGYHFFHEGISKLQTGSFDAEPFLRQAKGPLQPFFQRVLDDKDGYWRLCINHADSSDASAKPTIDTSITFAIWDDFATQAAEKFRFADPFLLKTLREQVSSTSDPVQRVELEQKIELLEKQVERSREIRRQHERMLTDFLDENRLEILAYVQSASRLDGFPQDGVNRQAAAQQVTSLRNQLNEIARKRAAQLPQWFASVEAIWNSFESQMNALALSEQKSGVTAPLRIHRPFDLDRSFLKIINAVVPWFDTVVGALLILGLFTRVAALLAGVFLASIALSQPFWVTGTADTWLQWIEIAALAVIFATCAGRIAGVDYFIRQLLPRRQTANMNAGVI